MARPTKTKGMGSSVKRANPFAAPSPTGISNDSKSNQNDSGLNKIEYGTDQTDLVAPDNILRSEPQARRLFQDLSRDHTTRFSEYAKIQAQFFGKRPRDPKKLKEQGLSYLSNINNGHARIHINRYLSSEYNLIHAVASPVNFRITLIDKKTDHMIARAMERAWKKVYPTWEDYYVQLDAMRQDKTIFGMGITLREFDAKSDASSWQFKAISPDQFLCPLDTDIAASSLSKFCITHTMPAQELWEIYNTLTDKDNEKDEGPWERESLAYVLWRASSKASGRNTGFDEVATWGGDILEMQRKIRNYDTSPIAYYNDDISLVSVYTKEWNGKWSHTIIHGSYHTREPIFFNSEQYEDINDFLQIWYFEPCNKTVHSVRGLGYRIFQPVEVQNRLDNVLIDQAHLGSTVFVRTRQGRGRDAKSVKINLGTVNDIGEAEFVQQLSASNLNSSLQVNQYQASILERNVQFEKMDLDGAEENKYRTLGEVGLQATKDAVLTKPQVSYFYRQYDKFIQNTVRLAYSRKPDAFFKEWKARVAYELKDVGLPMEVFDVLFTYPDKKQLSRQGLPTWMDVTATRSTSSGSQVADIMAVNRLFQLAQFMGTDERYTFLQMATAAFSDHDYVDILFPDKNRPQVFTDNMQKAVIENAILKLGNEIPVSPNDDHREEAPIHIQACQEILKGWADGGDVVQADDQMRVLYPHFLAHFTLLSQDPLSKAIFESLAPIRGEVENQYKQIQANAANARLADQRRQEEERVKQIQEQYRLTPNSPEMVQTLIDHELKQRQTDLQESRALRTENIQQIKANVKADLESSLTVKGFELDQRRKNIKLLTEIHKDKAKTNGSTPARR